MNIGSVIAMRILIMNNFSYDNIEECVSIVDSILCKVHTHKNIVHFLKIVCDLLDMKERADHQVSPLREYVIHVLLYAENCTC